MKMFTPRARSCASGPSKSWTNTPTLKIPWRSDGAPRVTGSAPSCYWISTVRPLPWSTLRGPDGNLYIATDAGEIWRVTPSLASP